MNDNIKFAAADVIKSREFQNALTACYLGKTGDIPVISVFASGRARVKAEPLLKLNLTEEIRKIIGTGILEEKGPFIIHDVESQEILIETAEDLIEKLHRPKRAL